MIDASLPPADARIPVSLGPAAPRAGAAFLVQDDLPAPDGFPAIRFRLLEGGALHGFGCACCAPRNPAAAALGALFQARARGEIPWFDRVIALVREGRGHAAVLDALANDLLVMARFVEADRP